MNLLRALFIPRSLIDLIREAAEILQLQRELMLKADLDAHRAMLNLAVEWRVSLERPEEDVRERLDAAIVDLSDHVARLEEHVS